jgi:hypothetical protein
MGRPATKLKVRDSEAVLRQAYQRNTCAVERRRLQVRRLMQRGKSRQEVKEETAYSDLSIREIVERYNEAGVDRLKDKRHENPGAPTLLSDEQLLQFGPGGQERLRQGCAVPLPPYSPELQPAEHLWQLSDEPLSTAPS